ncbi:MAG: hypothetical protein A2156_14495 [Deltaproteobacteria bacterium RBG_16_48_10]|nr:MAG: hypothetical protein A2156_14495 [Deltaproteobacteria bacterium RBG_16_48_10]
MWFLLSGIFLTNSYLWRFPSFARAQARKVLPKEFSKDEIRQMIPAEVDSRNLQIDPLDQFGTMGPTDVVVDVTTYRLKIGGAVERPLSLSYDQIIRYPSVTETVLLICPGFFANNGRWTGVDVKGAYEKMARIPVEELGKKRIFLAYRVNGVPLPRRHGFPLRLVFEDAYGDSWVKYVSDLVVS